MLKFFLLILFIILLTFFQAQGISIFSIKPNLALLTLAVAAFFISSIWEGLLFISLAALILKFSPVFEKEILFFWLIGAAIVIAQKYLPWHNLYGLAFFVGFGTFAFYFLTAPSLIISTIFAGELVLNLIVGLLIFAPFHFLWQNKS